VQFFLESTALALIGGVLGVALGILATAVAARICHNPVTIPLYVPFTGLGAAAAVGVLAGVYPAARAARLAPAQALRAIT
jgi:putative ABC transport system permease protein